MKSITIKGSQRESVGKASTKALRNAGKVPCVLYGGDNPVHFEAPELAFKNLVYTPDAHTVVIDLEGGKTFNAVLQDIQFHPVTDKILHIDFYQLYEDKPIAMNIPVKVLGNAPGVVAGGVLRVNKRKLRVKALPGNLPDFIQADISKLKIGSKIYIAELAHDDYTFLHPDNMVVCQVRMARAAMKAEDVEGEEEGEEGEATAAEGGDAAAAPAEES